MFVAVGKYLMPMVANIRFRYRPHTPLQISRPQQQYRSYLYRSAKLPNCFVSMVWTATSCFPLLLCASISSHVRRSLSLFN